MSDTSPEIRKGLNGVVVDETAVSKVNPETNSLTYRGYPVQELVEHCSFEDVAYLLWNGELPTWREAQEFGQRERAMRPLSRSLLERHQLDAQDRPPHGRGAYRHQLARCPGRHQRGQQL